MKKERNNQEPTPPPPQPIEFVIFTDVMENLDALFAPPTPEELAEKNTVLPRVDENTAKLPPSPPTEETNT